jgi:hypothetical protein
LLSQEFFDVAHELQRNAWLYLVFYHQFGDDLWVLQDSVQF